MADIRIVVESKRWAIWQWDLLIDGQLLATSEVREYRKELVEREAYALAALIPGCRVEVRG